MAYVLLLIEDNPEDVRLVHELLAGVVAFDLVVAPTLALGLDCLGAADAVLLDLKLPDSDGLDTLAAVRRRTQRPILVYTGFADLGQATRAVAQGACEYLAKGHTDTTALLNALYRALAARGEVT